MAYSLDGATTFTKYADNPVIDIDSTEFRDPMVFWHGPSDAWRMVITMSADSSVRVYGSGKPGNKCKTMIRKAKFFTGSRGVCLGG